MNNYKQTTKQNKEKATSAKLSWNFTKGESVILDSAIYPHIMSTIIIYSREVLLQNLSHSLGSLRMFLPRVEVYFPDS